MIRDKTNLLAVRLMGHVQSNLVRHPANLILRVFTDRHKRMGKLMLGQIVQCIRLVLRRCRRFAQGITAVLELLDSGLMAGGNVISPDVHTPLEQ